MAAADQDDIGRQQARQVMRRFFVPAVDGNVRPELEGAAKGASAELQVAADAFVYNVCAALSVAAFPNHLAIGGAQRWRFQQLRIAESIRARSDLGPDGNPTEAALADAHTRAITKFQQEMASKEGVDDLADSASEFLLAALENREVDQAADELLLQGAVLLWSAFETLARDLTVQYLNSQPHETLRLLTSQEGRKLFQLRALDLETLADHNFNVSERMGTVLSNAHNLGSLTTMRKVVGFLLPQQSKARKKLDSTTLWLLFQRRHVILHQRGIVDQEYLDKTGDDLRVGSRLKISPHNLMEYSVVVQETGAECISAFSTELAGR